MPGLVLMRDYIGLISGVIFISLFLQFMLNLFQFRFANQMKKAIRFTNQEAFEQSWQNFRNLFRWTGVLVVVMILLYFVLIFVMFSMLSSQNLNL